MPYAVVFPGQGAAAPGTGHAWRDHRAWAVVDEAEDLLDRPLGRLLLEADAEELATTGASQLAVLLASLLAWEAFSAATDDRPVAFAGHSLGQITALIASGAIERRDGLRLGAERAERSQRSADRAAGRMAALIGAELPAVQRACVGVDAWLANDNAPGQVVIAGTPAGVDQASDRSRDLGVRRVLPVDVGHAFHTPLLSDVAAELAPTLSTLPFRQPEAAVVANTDATPYTDPAVWPDQLARHLVEPVRWRESQYALTELGVDTFVEIGPGRVLAGLARRTVPDVAVRNVTSRDDVAGDLARRETAVTASARSSADRPVRSYPLEDARR